jgi:WD40 repeat protein
VDIVPEAASALRTTLAETRIEARLPTGYGAVAYSLDGTRLASDDARHSTVLLWDVDSRAELARWTLPQGADSPPVGIGQVAYSHDDAFLATTWVYVGDDLPPAGETIEAVTLHDPDTLDLKLSLSGEDGAYWAPSFGADDLIAATFIGENDTGAYVWDLVTRQVVNRFVSDPPILGGAFIPDTTILVLAHSGIRAAGGDMVEPGHLRAVDVSTSEEVWVIPDLEINPNIISVSPDGSKAVLADNNLVEIWDLAARERLHASQHPDPQTLTWSQDSTRLALSGNDADVTILDETQGWESLTLSGHKSSVWGTAFHPRGERLASASEEGQVLIWDITEAGAVGDEAVALDSAVGLFFLGPENRLIAGRDDGGGVTIDLATGEAVATLPIEASFSLMPNDSYTTVAGPRTRGSELPPNGVLVDALTGEVIRSFPECLTPRAISFDDRLVALDSMEGCDPNDTPAPSQVLDLETEEIVIDLGKRAVVKAVFSPASFKGPPFVAASIFGNDVEIYSLDDGELVAAFSLDELGVTGFGALALDPQGKYLAMGTIGPDSIVIDMKAIMSGVPKMDAVVFNVAGNNANTPQFRVTSDGVGASASFDPVYRVWDITTGGILFEIRVDGLDDLGAVNFTPDGRQLAYEDAGGVIRFTPIDTDEVVARALATVTRTLTEDECLRYLRTEKCVG